MKEFAVLGLGRFGCSVAESLSRMGAEVLGVDLNEERVEKMDHAITHVVQADILDSDALDSLGLDHFDAVILSVKDIEVSCLAAIALKEHGARYVVARAVGESHARILEHIGVDKVLMPEKDAAHRLARSLVERNILEYMQLSTEHSLVEIEAPAEWVGKTLIENNIRQRYGINVVAVFSGNRLQVSPAGDCRIEAEDKLLIIGSNNDIERLNKLKKK